MPKSKKPREDEVIDDGSTEYTGPSSKSTEDTMDMSPTPDIGMEGEINKANEEAKNVLVVTDIDLPSVVGKKAGDQVSFSVDGTVTKDNGDGTYEVTVENMQDLGETANEMPSEAPTSGANAGGGMGGLASLLGGKQ